MEHKDFSITRDLLKKAGDLGLSSAEIPEAYGGLEMDKVTAAVIADHIAKYAGFATTWGGHTGIGTLPIVYFGTEEQKQKYLPRPCHAFRKRQALYAERRKNVDYQRRIRRPVHRICQDRRRKVHCIPGREKFSRLFHRWRRAQDGHSGILYLSHH